MKNIEKYPNTKDALEAYDRIEIKDVTFYEWLFRTYDEPRMKTLLEAAEALKETWYKEFPHGKISDVVKDMGELADAIEREKRKPVRNCDKYNTVKDAIKAFSFMCDNTACEHCPYNQGEAFNCKFAWLYEEIGKEKSK